MDVRGVFKNDGGVFVLTIENTRFKFRAIPVTVMGPKAPDIVTLKEYGLSPDYGRIEIGFQIQGEVQMQHLPMRKRNATSKRKAKR